MAGSVLALFCATGPASAYEPPAGPAFSLAVTPTRLVVDQEHGHDEQSLEVRNRGRTPLDIQVQKRNFTAGLDGTLAFQADAPYSASEWVDVTPASFRLPPNSVRAVKVHIRIPAKPEPGDHQVALVFIVPAADDQPNIRLNRGIGTPVYITVPGAADDSVRLDGLTAPRFSMSGPVSFTTTLRDVGTVHRDFRGTERLGVRVGGKTVLFPDLTLLRGTDRRATAEWTHPPLVCFCTATVSVTNRDGTVHQATASVVIFPVHLVAIAIGIGLALFIAVRQARKRYRRQVLAAAQAYRSNDPGELG